MYNNILISLLSSMGNRTRIQKNNCLLIYVLLLSSASTSGNTPSRREFLISLENNDINENFKTISSKLERFRKKLKDSLLNSTSRLQLLDLKKKIRIFDVEIHDQNPSHGRNLKVSCDLVT